MLHLALVFCHFLAAALALGAIVATDLRLLSKLAQDRVRIAPPNEFVARIVIVSLVVLCLTGGALVLQGALASPATIANPKLQAKILLVLLLTMNAFFLHRVTFPRLARGRRIARWHALDWVLIAVPVAASNALWLFVAFLGVARAWNDAVPLGDVLAVGAAVFLVAQTGVVAILVVAGRPIEPAQPRWTDVVRRALASIGELGAPPRPVPGVAPRRRRDDAIEDPAEATSASGALATSRGSHAPQPAPAVVRRPALHLVENDRRGEARRRAR
jgi:hypothetical protein